MEINKLKHRAYEIAVKHGWYEEEKSGLHYAMLVVSEIGEAINADRKGKYAQRKDFEDRIGDVPPFSAEEHWISTFDCCIKDTVEDELADTAIRILSLAGHSQGELEEKAFSEENFKNGYAVVEHLYTGSDTKNLTLAEELMLPVKELVDCFGKGGSMGYVLFLVFFVAYRRGIDLEWFVQQKMKYNELRPYKHGGKKY